MPTKGRGASLAQTVARKKRKGKAATPPPPPSEKKGRGGAKATLSFGLVTIPVRIFPASRDSGGLSFHLLHRKDGVRLRQQLICPADGAVVPRDETVRGYEFEKDRYVALTDAELDALDEKATRGIELRDFVPLASVDPVYFERSDYLGPDAAGERPFGLFVQALEEMALAAIGVRVVRGKDYLVLLRPLEGRLVMHQLLHADEVRAVADVPLVGAESKAAELKLAKELIGQLASKKFEPSAYRDEVRRRVKALIDRKIRGEDTVEGTAAQPHTKVIDLMEALKNSLRQGKPQSLDATVRRRA